MSSSTNGGLTWNKRLKPSCLLSRKQNHSAQRETFLKKLYRTPGPFLEKFRFRQFLPPWCAIRSLLQPTISNKTASQLLGEGILGDQVVMGGTVAKSE